MQLSSPYRLAFLLTCLALIVTAPTAQAQQQIPSKVDISFNRFYDYEETTRLLRALVDAYPDLLTLESIGQSEQGREMWVVTLNNPKTGPDTSKPAMWIDGNVHGNEVQASETVLYSIWYLTKSYGQVKQLTDLMDRCAFYFLPMANPDGRDFWFHEPNTASTARTGMRPTDNDFDGLFDEDGPEDLDDDGHIGVMWRFDPNGTHRRNPKDPRLIERVGPGEKGELSPAGSEGIDNDGDGRINEDGPGGYDMNRNWPTDWQPNWIQGGAGEHPFSYPETKAIGEFILARPNIAAGQSYHNAGGMILRGPGAAYNTNVYSRADLAVYDELGRAGVEMLPFYRYFIIHADLYTVHGGFVNWLAEGLGIVSFTNELWTNNRLMQDASQPRMDDEARMRWMDRLLFGQVFTDWTEFDHPTLGKVLIGGNTKWWGRVPPPFMLEEECHRNFAFTMFHAENMPELRFNWIGIQRVGPLWEITVEIENDRIIPTRTDIATRNRIGRDDLLTLDSTDPNVTVAVGGTVNDRFARAMNPVAQRPHMLFSGRGVPGRGRSVFRFLVSGREGAAIRLHYTAEKAGDIDITFPLRAGEVDAGR